MTDILVTLIGLVLGGTSGWVLGLILRDRVQRPKDEQHNWMRSLPVVPGLMLLAIVLPYASLPQAVNALIVALLLVIPAFTFSLRYGIVSGDDETQIRINRRELLRTGWRDTVWVALFYLVSALLYSALSASVQDSVVDHLEAFVVAIPLAIVIGSLLGGSLELLHRQVVTVDERRYRQGKYSVMIDGSLNVTRNSIEALFTQFHGKRLTGVLVISATVLTFTEIDKNIALAVLLMPPVMSATLAALLVGEPTPEQPDLWQNLRTGLTNIMQICIGYMVGAGALIPLAGVHEWSLAHPDKIEVAFRDHLELTFVALGISLLIGLLGGVLSSRNEVLRGILINLGNMARTLPSLAVLALALPLFGIGFAPTMVALIFIGALPILVNTYIGVAEVSAEIKEAARGMGMNDREVLFKVEVPIAMPVIMAGIRTSAVLVVASATLATFIGGGGLGDLIVQGDAVKNEDMLLTGAFLATILAVFLEYFFGWLETLLTPRGLRIT